MVNGKDPVRIPGGAYDTGDDLAKPVIQLLEDIHVLGTVDDYKSSGSWTTALTGPPQSVAIIEAGATSASKFGSSAIASLGGVAATVAGIQGLWGHWSDPVRIAFVAGGALVLAAVAIAVAMIVSGDVQGRAAGSVAEYQARAQVTSTFLNLSRRPNSSQPSTALGTLIAGELQGLKGRRKGSRDYRQVTQVGWRPDEKQTVVKVGNEWIPHEDVEIIWVES